MSVKNKLKILKKRTVYTLCEKSLLLFRHLFVFLKDVNTSNIKSYSFIFICVKYFSFC